MDRRIVVVRHAVVQLQARTLAHESYEELESYIEQEVRAALAAGRFDERKPKSFRLYREKRKGKLFHQLDRCAWNADQSLAWIVRRHTDRDVVMTTLTRAVALKEAS